MPRKPKGLNKPIAKTAARMSRHPYMEKNQDFREIVISAKKAIEL